MNVEFTGRISKIGEVQNIKENFSKLDFVVDVTENNYTNSYPIQALNEKIEHVLSHKVGDLVSVKCNLMGKAFKSKEGKEMTFLNLNVWFIKGEVNITTPKAQKASTELDPNDEFPDLPSVSSSPITDDEDDNLPF